MTEFVGIGVLGQGTMGAGIARVLPTTDREVVALDTSPDAFRRGLDAMEAVFAGGVRRCKIDQRAMAPWFRCAA